MNKYFKAVGKGMIWGVKHPFKEVSRTDRYDHMKLTEAMCDALGVAIIQTGVGLIMTIGSLIALGYVGEKINNKPVKVEMVIDKDPEKKK